MLALVAALGLLLPPAVPSPEAPEAEDPARQFDFWIGEWSVNNRHLQADGAWVDSGAARARIVPVLGGAAILEEWSGTVGGNPMFGFSLRAYDPERGDWNLLLNWPGGGASFGTLRGSFRHGRGEFFAGQRPNLTRYSFSDALPNSLRWDSATTADGGQTWRTSWIMEFTRTKPAAELSGVEPWTTRWDPRSSCSHEAARGFDFAVGDWVGVERTRTEGGWTELPVRLRAARLIQDHAIATTLATGAGERPEREEFGIYAWIPRDERWEGWTCDRDHTVFRRSLGDLDAGHLILTELGRRRTTWSADAGRLYGDVEVATEGGGWRIERKIELERAPAPEGAR